MTSEIKPEDVKLPEPDLIAAYAYVDEMVPKASGVIHGGPVWHGWALREAYLAGVKAERERAARIAVDAMVREANGEVFEDDFNAACKQIAAAIRAGHSITETPLGEG